MKRWSGKHMRTTRGHEAVKRFLFLPYLVLATSLLSESLAQAVCSLIYFLTTHFKGWFCTGLVKAYVKYFSCTSLGPGVELKVTWQGWRELDKWNCFRFGQILLNLDRMFAVHPEKSFVPAFCKVYILNTSLITLSLEIILLEEKIRKKPWIFYPKIFTNPVCWISGLKR